MKKLLSMFFAFAAISVFAGEMCLVRDGQPQAEIVLKENPTASAQMGCFELNHHIKLITGTELPVVTGKGTPGKIHIELGIEDKPFEKEFTAVQFGKDTIRLYGFDNPVRSKVNYKYHDTFPGGFNGTLFAVYDFLERCCGVRWYGVTDEATAYVPGKTLTVRTEDHVFATKCDAFRDIWGSDPVLKYSARDMKLMRLRWRTIHTYAGTNHNVYRIYFTYWDKAKNPKYAALFREKRPDYFAKGYKGSMAALDGFLRREYPKDADCPPGICFSSKGVIDFFADQAVEQWKGMPMVGLPNNGAYTKRKEGVPFFSGVQHMDTQGPCHCAECRKRAASMSENALMWQWIADIANAAAAKQKGLGIATLAYQRTLAYPENVKLPDNVSVQLCLAPWAWWNPEYYKIQHDEVYKKWMDNKGGKVMTAWLYLFSPSWDSRTRYKHKYFPGVYPKHIGQYIKEMAKDGIKGYHYEVEFKCNRLEAYLTSRLFYDPDQDVDTMLDEYYRLFYGKAGDDIKAFYTELEDAFWNWKNYPAEMFGKNSVAKRQRAHSIGSGMLTAERNWSVGTAERMKRLSSLLDAAEAKAESPLIRKRIQWIRDGFWTQAVQGKIDNDRRKKVTKMPTKSIVIPVVPDAKGDVNAINWSKAAAAGDCHTLAEGDTVPGAFQLKMAADSRYLYFDFLEKKEQEKPHYWDNFFEIFLSEGQGKSVFQAAMDPTIPIPMSYKSQNINDVMHTVRLTFPGKFVQLGNKGEWHWRMALPLSCITDKKELRQLHMNFRRFTPDLKLVWNKFFSSAAEAAECMGYVLISGISGEKEETITFREGRFKGDVGEWYLLRGTISFIRNSKAVQVRMKNNDLLVYDKRIGVVPGDTVTIRWNSGKTALNPTLRLFLGNQWKGALRGKMKKLENETCEAVFQIPQKNNVTDCRLEFSTVGSAEFELSDVVIKSGRK